MNFRKKGDASANAMWLVLIIGLFLVVYIILLPVGEKEKLVGIQPIYGPTTGGSGGSLSGGLLLQENPGVLYPLIRQVVGKPLASVNLFSYTEGEQQGLANTVTVEHGFFGEQEKELSFFLNDVRTVQDVQLLFLVREAKGDLIIRLNGEEVFRGEPTTEDLPLRLPPHLLKQINKLIFTVSNPGLNIFKTNVYSLKDVQLFVRHRLENKREVRTFVMNKADAQSVKHLTLFFVTNCFTVEEDGRLIILLNGKVIHDALVVCDAGPIAVDIDPQDILEGTNTLEFGIDQGKYVLEQVVLEKDVGEHEPTRYVFTMQVADFNRVGVGGRIVMDMQFAPDGLRKIGAVYINGYPIYFDTLDYTFVYDVTGLVGPGTNIVRIVPEVPVDITAFNIGFGL